MRPWLALAAVGGFLGREAHAVGSAKVIVAFRATSETPSTSLSVGRRDLSKVGGCLTTQRERKR